MPSDNTIETAQKREAFVQQARELLQAGASMDDCADQLGISAASLSRWMKWYEKQGFLGILTHQEACGRPSVAGKLRAEMGNEAFEEVVNTVTGQNYDLKSNSLSWRRVADAPDAPEALREYMDKVETSHASQHNIARSLTKETRLTQEERRRHRGPKQHKLESYYIPRKLDILPGDVYVSDDETDIIYCAIPVPPCEKYPHGFKAMQVQTFPMLDVASQYVGFTAHIARERGSYRATDIWAFLGRGMQAMDMPRLGFQFERGTWESNLIRGVEVVYDQNEPSPTKRIGGLKMLPSKVLPWHHEHAHSDMTQFPKTLQIFTSYNAKSKSVEGWFNRIQKFRQMLWGYAGRDQRREPTEKMLKIFGKCQRGTLNPAEHLMLFSEMADKYRDSVMELNEVKMEGEIWHGKPVDVWNDAKAQYPQLTLPAEMAWMYRSEWAQTTIQGPLVIVRKVNELTRIKESFAYENPLAFMGRDGERVLVYYDRDNIAAPAQVLSARSGEFICQADYFDKPGMFLDARAKGFDMIAKYENFAQAQYREMKKHIPSLQKPDGVASRQQLAKEIAQMDGETPESFVPAIKIDRAAARDEHRKRWTVEELEAFEAANALPVR